MLLRPTFTFIPSVPRRTPADRRRVDGYRMMVHRAVSGVRVLTHNGKDWTGRFPNHCGRRLGAQGALLSDRRRGGLLR